MIAPHLPLTPRPWWRAVAAVMALALSLAAPIHADMATATAPAPAPTADPRVLFIPQAEWYPALLPQEGVTMPWAELRELLEQARRVAEDPAVAAPATLGVRSAELRLELRPDGTLEGEGTLTAERTGQALAAVAIHRGALSWKAQPTAEATLVTMHHDGALYLATADRATSATGTLAAPFGFVTGPVWQNAETASYDLGMWRLPLAGTLKLPTGFTVDEATAGLVLGEAASSDAARPFWIEQGALVRLVIRRQQAPGAAATSGEAVRTVTLEHHRPVVHDAVTLALNAAPGETRTLHLGEGVHPFNATLDGPGTVRWSAGAIELTDLPRGVTTLRLAWDWLPDETDGAFALPAGPLAEGIGRSRLVLAGDARQAFVLEQLPVGLVAAEGAATNQLAFAAWGALPAVQLRLAGRLGFQPRLLGEVNIEGHGATASWMLEVPDTTGRAAVADLPEGWELAGVSIRRGTGQPVPATADELRHDMANGRRLEIWNTGRDEASIAIHIALRTASVGATMSVPVLQVSHPVVASYQTLVKWGPEVEVLVSAGDGGRVFSARDRRYAHVLSAGGSMPPQLQIQRRRPEVAVVVATTLVVQERQARVQALATFEVGQAPQSVFQLRVPSGAGGEATIEGDLLRDARVEPQPDHDLITLTATVPVMGAFAVRMEWPLPAPAAGGMVWDAPRIEPLGTATQRGFLVLEAAGGLRLASEASNLAEADLAELPAWPWTREHRVLEVYRYVQPNYALRVTATGIQPEPPLPGLVSAANLATQLLPDGSRITRVEYDVAAGLMGARQFLEVALSPSARVWSVLVDGEGVRPSRRDDAATGRALLMIPLPPAGLQRTNTRVSLLFAEPGVGPMTGRVDAWRLSAPDPGVPVAKTEWKLYPAPGVELLAYGDPARDQVPAEPSLLNFWRTAYWPSMLLFPEMSLSSFLGVLFGMLILALVGRGVLNWWRSAPKSRTGQPGEAQGVPGCGRIVELLIVLGIVAILSAIAVPNFLEAQVRAKHSRIKNDTRSIATAIESYYVDNNAYPPSLDILWQGPVKYLSFVPVDPMVMTKSGGGAPYRYATGPAAAERLRQAGIAIGNANAPGWVVWGLGPDGRDQDARVVYDPTNGTASPGDVIRHSDSFGAAVGYDSSGGTTSSGDVWRTKDDKGWSAAYGRVAVQEQVGQATNKLTGAAPDERARQLRPSMPDPASVDMAQQMPRSVPVPASAAPPVPLAESQREGRPVHSRLDAMKPLPNITVSDGESNSPVDVDRFAFQEAANFAPEGQENVQFFEVDDLYKEERDATILYSIDTGPVSPNAPASSPFSSASGIGGGAAANPFGASASTATPGAQMIQQGVARGRDRSLLSMRVELPESGEPREFQSFASEPSVVDISAMGSIAYRRWQRVAFLAPLLLLGIVALVRPRLYAVALMTALLVALGWPLVAQGAAIPFANAAVWGALASVAVAAIGQVGRLFRHSPIARGHGAAAGIKSHSVSALLLLLCLSGAAPLVAADEAPAPLEIYVPYTPAQWPAAFDRPVATMARATFEHLWRLAHPQAAHVLLPAPAGLRAGIASLQWDGVLDPRTGIVEARVRIVVFNPEPEARQVSLNLPGFQPIAGGDSTGASLFEHTPEGLAGHLPAATLARWEVTGRYRARFDGPEAALSLAWPASATTSWSLTTSQGGIESATLAAVGGAAPVRLSVVGSQRIVGAGWQGERNLRLKLLPVGAAPEAAERLSQANVRLTVKAQSLEQATYDLSLDLTATPGNVLPAQLALATPGWKLLQAGGEGLVEARSTGDETVLTLAPERVARITLSGTIALPRNGNGARLALAPLFKSATPAQLSTRLELQVAGALEAAETASEGLNRTSAAAVEGMTATAYTAPTPAWRLELALLPRERRLVAAWEELHGEQGNRHLLAASLTLTHDGGTGAAAPVDLRVGPLPAGLEVRAVEGEGLLHWVQTGDTLFVRATSPQPGERVRIVLSAEGVATARGADIQLVPPAIAGAELRSVVASWWAPRSEEWRPERSGQGAAVGQPSHSGDLKKLIERHYPGWWREMPEPSSAALRPGESLRLKRHPVQPLWSAQVINRLDLGEGVADLSAIVMIEPRRGLVTEIPLLLVGRGLDAMDDGWRFEPPVKALRWDAAATGSLQRRVTVELDTPVIAPVTLVLRRQQAIDTSDGALPELQALLPQTEQNATGAAHILAARTFEGELVAGTLGSFAAQPAASLPWPSQGMPDALRRTLPSDRAFVLRDLGVEPRLPEFKIVRHKRQAGLRAVVEVLRLRALLREEGGEAHELEIVAQNESEQFIKLALPAPRERITLYQVLVAGRPAGASFGMEDGREVLLVPLLRTGLLEPELTIRVAYTIEGGLPMRGSGPREVRLPEVLGGVPVAQSALVMMLPETSVYSKFEGTMAPVEQLELEVDEANRRARKLEMLSKALLENEAGAGNELAYRKVDLYRQQAQQQLTQTETMVSNVGKRGGLNASDMAMNSSQLGMLQEAKKSQIFYDANLLPQSQSRSNADPFAAVEEEEAAVVPFEFPRSGEVRVFRQLQGTGFVTFRYASKPARERWLDAAFGGGLAILFGCLVLAAPWLVASRRRMGTALILAALVLLGVGALRDVAVLMVAVGVWLWWSAPPPPAAR